MNSDGDPTTTAERRIRVLHAMDLTSQTLGIVLEKVSPGRASVWMRVAETMVNGYGIAHGGYLFLLADVAFSYACNTHGLVNVASSAQVTFLRPVEVGEKLIAEAVERTRYGRSGIYDVTVQRPDGVTVAEFRGQSQMLTSELVVALPE
ncbi:MAG: hydroxyphenylacetyl-CoA thioesterase PaaI [Pseudonocardiaceae bacterium]